MSTITKEWLQQKIADMEAARDEIPFGLNEDDSNTLAALRIALASLEAEAAAYMVGTSLLENMTQAIAYKADTALQIKPLYTAPPAPVSAPECFKRLLHHAYGMTMGHDWNKGTMAGHHRTKLCQAVEECRAAMLKGADGNSPATPDGWVACSERMPEEGSKVIVFRPHASESNDPPIKTATYKGGREYYHGFDCYCEPTHWMPMPAAPQQEA